MSEQSCSTLVMELWISFWVHSEVPSFWWLQFLYIRDCHTYSIKFQIDRLLKCKDFCDLLGFTVEKKFKNFLILFLLPQSFPNFLHPQHKNHWPQKYIIDTAKDNQENSFNHANKPEKKILFHSLHLISLNPFFQLSFGISHLTWYTQDIHDMISILQTGKVLRLNLR